MKNRRSSSARPSPRSGGRRPAPAGPSARPSLRPVPDETADILYRTMSQGVVFRDGAGRILSANPAAERMFGRPLADLLGKTSAEVHHGAVDGNEVLLGPEEFPAETALRTGAPVRGFVLGITNPGEKDRRWLSVDAMPILRPGDERPSMVYILCEDITERRRMMAELERSRLGLEQEVQDRTRELTEANEALTVQVTVRKRAEAALRESEEKFRRLAENAQDLITIFRILPERGFEYVSASATAMTGYTPDELYGDPDLVREIVHPDDRGLLDKVLSGATDPAAPLVLRWVRKDGRIIWTEQRNIPVRDPAGRIVALQGIARDVTERVRNEEKLRENERFLQTVIETEPECVKMLAPDGTVLMMNRAGLEMIDAGSLDQVKGASIYSLIDPPYRQDFIRLTEETFRGRTGMLAFEATGLRGRKLWLETHCVPLKDERGAIIAALGITRDITHRKVAEEKLRENEKFLQTVIETEPECVKLLARDGSLLMMNRAGLEMIQAASLDQVKDRPAVPLVAPEHRRAFGELLASVFQGRSGTLVFEMVGLKGRRLWMDTHMAPLRDESGAIIAALGITRDITERKRIEEAVKEREFWVRESQRVARLGSYVLDLPTGRWTGSEILDDIFGIGKDYDRTVAGWSDILHPDDRARMLAYFSSIVAERSRFSAAYRIVRKSDGQERWVNGLGELVLDASGVPVKMLGTIQDVTESMHAEQALRESEQRYRQLLESVTSYIYTVQVEKGRAVSTTHGSACLAVTGYSAGEFAADPFLWYRMVHDGDRSAVLAQSSLLLAGGRPGPLEHRLLHKNGRTVWVRSTLVPRCDAQGRLVAYDGLIEDITERKRSEAFVKDILETVDEGFAVIDRNLTIVTTNRAYLAQVGLESGMVIGRKCHEVTHHLSGPCYEHGEECVVQQALRTGESHSAEHTHYDRRGMPIIVETHAFPLRGDAGEIVAAIETVRNITERRTLEEQLRHAQKMEAVGLLAGGIAHDFNNILTAIVGYGNLLKMKTPADDARQEYIDQLLSSTSRAASLTQSLLAFSRKQTINPRVVDLNEVIGRFERLLRRVIGEDIDLRIDLASVALTALVDPSQVEQVLMNLVTNARDAMPSGGTLSISAAPAAIDEAFRSSHGFGEFGAYASITVADSGVGMDQATIDHIFEPFFTTKELGTGAGLGLATVYGIMKQNKGYITVESRPGAGARFQLYFPLVSAAAEQPPAAGEQTAPEGHETVLVAEDDAQLRRLTATMLTEFGYTVIEAADGEEAVRKCREHAGEVKLAILDMVMPRLSGQQARDAILRSDPAVKVLFLSGYSAEVLSVKGITDENCIPKPVSPMDLLRAVRRALDSGNGQAGPGGPA